MSASATIAAASIRSEKRIVQTLKAAGATSAETAIALAQGPLIRRGALRRLLRGAAVIEVPADDGWARYWLDEAAYQEMRNRRQSRLLLSIFGVAALALVITAVVFARLYST